MANATVSSTPEANLDPEMDAIDEKETLGKGLQPTSSTDIGEMDGSGTELTLFLAVSKCLTYGT
jgi:hypothetical protein